MIFPITDLLDESESSRWLARYFHPQGFGCPQCQAGVEHGRVFRHSKRGLVDYRCKVCARVYNLYIGTVFAGSQLSASQAVLLLRGVCKGESTVSLAEELGACRSTVHLLRQKVQANGSALLAKGPVPDVETETDEMFRNAGKKGERHADPSDPPRRRANKRRGHGTYENDRPPVVGTIGRRSGRCRLRVREQTDGRTLRVHVHRYTRPQVRCYTDEWQGYNRIARPHLTVCHGQKEWARDDDGDGIREVHTNTIEGLWTTVRNFLRPFRGVHKKYLQYYLAMCEHRINRKRISPAFIAGLVVAHKT